MDELTPSPEVQEISPQDLMAELQNGRPLRLLDVREPDEWRQARIPGDVLYISMDEIPERLAELKPEADYVVFCAHGFRSYAVTEYLLENGRQARSLQGGITAWYLARGPIETGEA